MSVKHTSFEGDVTICRDVAIGGRTKIGGRALVKGNLTVGGWFEARHLKTPCKGLFSTSEDLESAYPEPLPGWWALVGTTLPAPIWAVKDGRWTATGGTGGEVSPDLDTLVSEVEALEQLLGKISPTQRVVDLGNFETASAMDIAVKEEALDVTEGAIGGLPENKTIYASHTEGNQNNYTYFTLVTGTAVRLVRYNTQTGRTEQSIYLRTLMSWSAWEAWEPGHAVLDCGTVSDTVAFESQLATASVLDSGASIVRCSTSSGARLVCLQVADGATNSVWQYLYDATGRMRVRKVTGVGSSSVNAYRWALANVMKMRLSDNRLQLLDYEDNIVAEADLTAYVGEDPKVRNVGQFNSYDEMDAAVKKAAIDATGATGGIPENRFIYGSALEQGNLKRYTFLTLSSGGPVVRLVRLDVDDGKARYALYDGGQWSAWSPWEPGISVMHLGDVDGLTDFRERCATYGVLHSGSPVVVASRKDGSVYLCLQVVAGDNAAARQWIMAKQSGSDWDGCFTRTLTGINGEVPIAGELERALPQRFWLTGGRWLDVGDAVSVAGGGTGNMSRLDMRDGLDILPRYKSGTKEQFTDWSSLLTAMKSTVPLRLMSVRVGQDTYLLTTQSSTGSGGGVWTYFVFDGPTSLRYVRRTVKSGQTTWDPDWTTVSLGGGDLVEDVKELQDAVFPTTASLSANRSLVEWTGSAIPVTLTWSVKRKGEAVQVTALTVSDGQSSLYSGTENPGSVEGQVKQKGTTRFTLSATSDSNQYSSSASVTAVLPMYFGFSPATSGVDITSLTKQAIKTGPSGTYTLNNASDGQYLWLCVPDGMSVGRVTLNGFDVPMEAASAGSTALGGYKCYRSSNALTEGSFTFMVS